MADGNQITRKTSSTTWRDSSGRTRIEVGNGKGGVRSSNIVDPSDGSCTILSPDTKTATRITMDKDFAARIEKIKERAIAQARRATDGKGVSIEKAPNGEQISRRGTRRVR